MNKEFLKELLKCTNIDEIEKKVKEMKNIFIVRHFGNEVVLLKVEQHDGSYCVYPVYLYMDKKDYSWEQIFCSLWYSDNDKVLKFEQKEDYHLITTENGKKIKIIQKMEEKIPYMIKLSNGKTGTGSWNKEEIGL